MYFMKSRLGTKIILNIGLFMFILSMYTILTLTSITESWTLTLIFLIISAGLLVLYSIITRSSRVSSISVVGLVFAVFCLFGVLQGAQSIFLLFYILCFIILLCAEAVTIDSLIGVIKAMRAFGMFFAFGCYWQFLFPDQYYAILFPLFGSVYQQSIRRQFYYHKMCTGFTSQTAAAAQFIVLGLISVIYLYQFEKEQNITGSRNKLSIIRWFEALFLIGALLLTGKRSPIVNLGCAFLFVDMITTQRSKKAMRFFQIIFVLTIMIFILFLFAPMLADSRNSIVRLIETISNAENSDITNGRLSLYSYALKEFMGSPVFGIGWGNYGPLYNASGAHNIYLQLLCECGIIGFPIAVGCMIFVLSKAVKQLKNALRENNSSNIIICKMSVFIQVYILVYGIFGNPIYDQNYFLMYVLGLLFSSRIYFERMHLQINSV